MLQQAFFLGQRWIRPADIEAARGQFEIRNDRLHPLRVEVDNGRAFHSIGHGLERHPATGVARHRPAMQAVIQVLLNSGRRQHRHHHRLENMFGLVRQRGAAGAVVVTGNCQHATEGRGPGSVGMPEHIATAVDTGALAVPHAEHAIVLGALENTDLLCAPHRGGCQVFVDPRMKYGVIGFQMIAGFPQRLVEPAQGGAAVAGDETGSIQPIGQIALALHQGQANQRLNAGQQDLAVELNVLVVQGRGLTHGAFSRLVLACVRVLIGLK